MGRIAWPALALSSTACVTNHDALAARDRPGTEPDSGVEGGEDVVGPDGGSEHTAESGRPPPVDAPPEDSDGPWSLKVVNGVVDETSAVAFCFAPIIRGTERAAMGDPTPSSGLGYGSTYRPAIPDDIDLEEHGLRVYVLAGELGRIADLDCQDAIAYVQALGATDAGEVVTPREASVADAAVRDAPSDGREASTATGNSSADGGSVDATSGETGPPPVPPSPLRVGAMAALPPKTLASSRSYLLVAAGCIGGGVYPPSVEKSVCGERLFGIPSTLTPVLVRLSRDTERDASGLQFLNAVVPFAAAAVRSIPPASSTTSSFTIASNVAFGQIAPRTPRRRSAALLASEQDDTRLEVTTTGSSRTLYAETWASTLKRGDVREMQNGSNYAVILLGPYPSYGGGPWWNDNVLTLVESAP